MLRWKKKKVEPGGLESIRHGLGGHHTTEPLTHRSLTSFPSSQDVVILGQNRDTLRL